MGRELKTDSRPNVNIHRPTWEVYCEACGVLDDFSLKRDAKRCRDRHVLRHCSECGGLLTTGKRHRHLEVNPLKRRKTATKRRKVKK